MIEGIVPFKVTQTVPEIIQVFAVDEIALLDGINVRLYFLGEEAAVILPGFHHHGEIRQLCSTVINVQAPQVVLHDAGGCFTSSITIVLINLHQHIKEHAEDMT